MPFQLRVVARATAAGEVVHRVGASTAEDHLRVVQLAGRVRRPETP